MRVTLKDVAAAAGVSPATASRVLRGTFSGAVEVRDRVIAAVETTGYRPNPASRIMRTGRTAAIAVVVDDLAGPWSAGMLEAIAKECVERQLLVALWSMRHLDEESLAKAVSSHAVDGVVWLAATVPVPAGLVGLPTVVVGSTSSGTADVVELDHKHDMSAVARKFADSTRLNVAVVGDLDQAPERVDAFQVAVRTFDLRLDRRLVIAVEDSVDGGRSAVADVVSRRVPDAVLALSDPVAVGLVDGLRAIGFASPRHLWVVSHGGSLVAALDPYQITTLTPDVTTIAAEVLELLTRRIDDPTAESRRVTVRSRWVERLTTADPLSVVAGRST